MTTETGTTETGTTDASPEPEQSFLSHLIELRQRLVRAAIAIVIVFAALTPFMKDIFDLMSKPMMAALPDGAKLLATG
ncbi:MAG: twin-arginine translocase subunit TatC, partial [Bradyrhizobium sp.]